MRPAWSEKLAVVMTSSNKDPEEWRAVIGNDAHKKELERRFKDNAGPLKIVIVVDMWLTGFDVPSLATMYVYKPMAGHNLMQAIARVNRVFGDKQGGLVVDYVGIASALKQAMNDYTLRDRRNYGDPDIAKTAYPEFRKKLAVCRDLLHGYDYAGFRGNSDLERARAISGGADFLQAPERAKVQEDYIREALLLRQALSLCQSMPDREERLEAAYFEAVRTLLTRVEGKGKISFREINERINELLRQSIQSEGVINLFSDVQEEFSLFDPKFLEEIGRMKEKNLAVELLRKLIAEQVQLYRRTNTVRAAKFSEILAQAMSNYLKGMLTNEEVIEELLKTAREIIDGEKAGQALHLTTEELAFYDALTKPERPTAGHHTRTDRCPAQKQDNRLESEGERPGRHASAGQTTAQEVQISARGTGGRTEHHHGAVRNVVGKQLSQTANRPSAVQMPYKFKRKPRCRHLQRGFCEV